MGLDTKTNRLLWTPPFEETQRNEDTLEFGKVKVEKYESPVNVNIPMELLACPVLRIQGRNGCADPTKKVQHIWLAKFP